MAFWERNGARAGADRAFNPRVLAYLLGYGLSTVGDWAALSGLSYLVYERASLAQLGLLQSVSVVMAVLVAPLLAGFVDRAPPTRIIVWANLGLFALSFGFLHFGFAAYLALLAAKSALYEASRLAQDRWFPMLMAASALGQAMGGLSLIRESAAAAGLALGVYLAAHYGVGVFLFDAASFAVFALVVAYLGRRLCEARTSDGRAALHPPGDVAATGIFSLSGPRNAAEYLMAKPHLLPAVLVFALCHLLWGMKDVIGISVVESHFQQDASFFGAYSAVGQLAEVAVMALVVLGIVRLREQVPFAAWMAFLLGVAFVLPALFESLSWAIATKFAEGAFSVMTGLLFGYILVLRAPAYVRASMSAVVGALTSLCLILGKTVAGFAAGRFSGIEIYAAFGCLVSIAVLGVWAFWVRTMPLPAHGKPFGEQGLTDTDRQSNPP